MFNLVQSTLLHEPYIGFCQCMVRALRPPWLRYNALLSCNVRESSTKHILYYIPKYYMALNASKTLTNKSPNTTKSTEPFNFIKVHAKIDLNV